MCVIHRTSQYYESHYDLILSVLECGVSLSDLSYVSLSYVSTY